MNKAIKTISIIMMAVLLIGALAMPVFAVDVKQFEGGVNSGAVSGVTSIFQNVIGIVRVVGTGIAIVMLMVLAIKYIMSAPDKKAEIKSTAIPYIVGAVLLFAAVNIMAAIQELAEGIRV